MQTLQSFFSGLVLGQYVVSGNIRLSSSFCVLWLEGGFLKDAMSTENELYHFVLNYEPAGVL